MNPNILCLFNHMCVANTSHQLSSDLVLLKTPHPRGHHEAGCWNLEDDQACCYYNNEMIETSYF